VLHETGLSVPRDISLVGFDDIPEASYFTPPLTTVRQDFIEVGRRSLRLLLEQIETGVRSRSEPLVRPELVVRQSTAGPTLR
jgi:DNA-binding LacI/PurR family transcriptional regulator